MIDKGYKLRQRIKYKKLEKKYNLLKEKFDSLLGLLVGETLVLIAIFISVYLEICGF